MVLDGGPQQPEPADAIAGSGPALTVATTVELAHSLPHSAGSPQRTPLRTPLATLPAMPPRGGDGHDALMEVAPGAPVAAQWHALAPGMARSRGAGGGAAEAEAALAHTVNINFNLGGAAVPLLTLVLGVVIGSLLSRRGAA